MTLLKHPTSDVGADMNNSDSLQNPPKIIKKIGLRKAVDNHCKACIYDELEQGTWRAQVERCTVTNCDLYPFRPRPIKTANEVDNEN